MIRFAEHVINRINRGDFEVCTKHCITSKEFMLERRLFTIHLFRNVPGVLGLPKYVSVPIPTYTESKALRVTFKDCWQLQKAELRFQREAQYKSEKQKRERIQWIS